MHIELPYRPENADPVGSVLTTAALAKAWHITFDNRHNLRPGRGEKGDNETEAIGADYLVGTTPCLGLDVLIVICVRNL